MEKKKIKVVGDIREELYGKRNKRKKGRFKRSKMWWRK